MLLIAGASAITDRSDVLPAAIVAAGGEIEHFGMPVDPGNLLLLARLDGRPVLGLPGCCRSPKLNGFDWVLERLAAGIEVTGRDIMRMGVGGLLMEIASRPQPREAEGAAAGPPRTAAVILAAGQSRRMGGPNKLLLPIGGKPMVRHVVEAAMASRATPVVVVVGHQQHEVRQALRGLKVQFVANPDFVAGLSTSLKAGLDALPASVDGAVVCLGDMPRVTATLIDRLIGAFNPVEGRGIVLPTWNGKRGNPVLWARAFFAEMHGVAGDVGARHLIGQHPDAVVEVEAEDDASLVDIDTPEALAAFAEAGP
jgi:molybdenum cofactor cytidylyltransferase